MAVLCVGPTVAWGCALAMPIAPRWIEDEEGQHMWKYKSLLGLKTRENSSVGSKK